MKQDELYSLLHILRDSFQDIFGERFERMILYGSRARGDQREDSDVDVLVVLRGEVNYSAIDRQIGDLIATLCLENDLLISTSFISAEQFHKGGNPFLMNVRREGVPL